jgi:hypothetical protein
MKLLLFFSSVKRRERTVALVSHQRPKLKKFSFYKRVLVLDNVMFLFFYLIILKYIITNPFYSF